MVGWKPTKKSPGSAKFAKAGWKKYKQDGHGITNLYINNSVSPT